MIKKVGIGIIALIILGVVTGIIDYNRVLKDKMPIFMIAQIDKGGPEINYYGLGYKMIRKPGVSYKSSLDHDVYVKFGSWFYQKPVTTELGFAIVDKTPKNCAEALEQIYETEHYRYYFNCVKSQYVFIKFLDKEKIPIKKALTNNLVSIEELIATGLNIIEEEK
ncbi:MAG: hypothetical protein PHI05_05220 [Bacilli bacterium]|nr:hypothetical protein [Bacilli bacterium]